MPSAYTPLLQLVLPVTGELNGTWGNTVNTQLTTNVENSIAGYSTKAFTPVDLTWTLTTTGGGVSNEARTAILICTGTPAATCTIYAPKSSKTYVVINSTDSLVYLRGGPTGPTTSITAFVPAGSSALFAWDDVLADFVKVAGGSGGATGTGVNQVFFENDLTVTASYTIPTGKNAGTFGPITINSGVTVTIPDDSVWSIV